MGPRFDSKSTVLRSAKKFILHSDGGGWVVAHAWKLVEGQKRRRRCSEKAGGREFAGRSRREGSFVGLSRSRLRRWKSWADPDASPTRFRRKFLQLEGTYTNRTDTGEWRTGLLAHQPATSFVSSQLFCFKKWEATSTTWGSIRRSRKFQDEIQPIIIV